jgi:hypothetical protein
MNWVTINSVRNHIARHLPEQNVGRDGCGTVLRRGFGKDTNGGADGHHYRCQ